MKILHIYTNFQIGGIQRFLVDLINEQIKYHKVYLIIINNNINHDLI